MPPSSAHTLPENTINTPHSLAQGALHAPLPAVLTDLCTKRVNRLSYQRPAASLHFDEHAIDLERLGKGEDPLFSILTRSSKGPRPQMGGNFSNQIRSGKNSREKIDNTHSKGLVDGGLATHQDTGDPSKGPPVGPAPDRFSPKDPDDVAGTRLPRLTKADTDALSPEQILALFQDGPHSRLTLSADNLTPTQLLALRVCISVLFSALRLVSADVRLTWSLARPLPRCLFYSHHHLSLVLLFTNSPPCLLNPFSGPPNATFF